MFNPLTLNPGDLRHKITISAPDTSTHDAYGQNTSWVPILTTRASITAAMSASARDSFAQNALAAQSSELMTIRYPGDSVVIKPGYRVTFGDTTWTIQDTDNVQHRDRVLRIACLAIEESST